jgi:peptidoglycan/LPS O-acetylase OafA/YrhL
MVMSDFPDKKYIKNLDGLRAYSVIGVLLFHANISSHFYYGWLGVQVFFIISGYLITTILLDSKDSKNFFKIFYARRILRIFPIYYLALIFTVIFAFIINSSIKDIWYYLLYIQNYRLSWVNWNPQFPPLLNHTWSLAIEEQFYLFWPLMIWLLSKRKLIILCLSLILTAFFVKYFLSLKFPANPINWANTFANFDMLASGALLAIILKKVDIKKVLISCLILSIFTLLIYLLVFYLKPSHHLFWETNVKLTEIDGQAFIILVIPFIVFAISYLIYKNNIFTKIFFSNSIIVYIGKISYGIYLYHLIVFLIIDRYCHINNIFIISTSKFFLTMLISVLSWHLIEKRFLSLKRYFSY